jgi:hypothetical protein
MQDPPLLSGLRVNSICGCGFFFVLAPLASWFKSAMMLVFNWLVYLFNGDARFDIA